MLLKILRVKYFHNETRNLGIYNAKTFDAWKLSYQFLRFIYGDHAILVAKNVDYNYSPFQSNWVHTRFLKAVEILKRKPIMTKWKKKHFVYAKCEETLLTQITSVLYMIKTNIQTMRNWNLAYYVFVLFIYGDTFIWSIIYFYRNIFILQILSIFTN